MEDVYLEVLDIDIPLVSQIFAADRDKLAASRSFWVLLPHKHVGEDYLAGIFNSETHMVEECAIDEMQGIQPVMLIAGLDKLNLPRLSTLEIFGHDWTYIGNDVVFCDNTVAVDFFDLNSSDYDKSQLKSRVKNILAKWRKKYDNE